MSVQEFDETNSFHKSDWRAFIDESKQSQVGYIAFISAMIGIAKPLPDWQRQRPIVQAAQPLSDRTDLGRLLYTDASENAVMTHYHFRMLFWPKGGVPMYVNVTISSSTHAAFSDRKPPLKMPRWELYAEVPSVWNSYATSFTELDSLLHVKFDS